MLSFLRNWNHHLLGLFPFHPVAGLNKKSVSGVGWRSGGLKVISKERAVDANVSQLPFIGRSFGFLSTALDFSTNTSERGWKSLHPQLHERSKGVAGFCFSFLFFSYVNRDEPRGSSMHYVT